MRVAKELRRSRADMELEAMGVDTLKKHDEILDNLAEKMNLHIEPEDVYKEVISGDSLSERPEMQRLLKKVMSGYYDGVLVVEVDRLARGNTKDQGIITETFKLTGTKVITPYKVYDLTNPADEDLFESKLYNARQEYKSITRRLQSGKEHAIRSGSYQGTYAPYGYEIVKEKRKRFLKPIETAETVRMIFNMWTEERTSAGEIARRLTSMGIPSPIKNPYWSKETIKRILHNVAYIGHNRWYQYKQKIEFNSDFQPIKKYIKNEPLIIENTHEPIISVEQFELAGSLWNYPRKNHSKELKNPLASIVKCARCGRALASKGKNYLYHNHIACTKTTNVRLDILIDEVCSVLEREVKEIEIKITDDAPDDTKVSLERLRKELRKLKTQKDKLHDYLEEGVYTVKEFSERKEVVTGRIESVESEIKLLSAKKTVNFEQKVVSLKQIIEALRDKDISAKSKNDLLKSVISRIYVDRDKDLLEIEINFI